MYIDGHREILAEVVATRLTPDFFDGWPGNPRVLHMIRVGLTYPDLPCGKVKPIVKGEPALIMHRPKLCSILAVTSLLRPHKQHNEMYQSHLGMLAYLHAMSPDPRSTAGTVTHAIVSHALSLALLFRRSALAPPLKRAKPVEVMYPFWLGVLLHTVTDSYAEAHTVRHRGRPMEAAVPPSDEQDDMMRRATALYALAGRTLGRPLSRPELADELKKRVSKHHHRLYMMYVFHRQTDHEVRRALPGTDRLITQGTTGVRQAQKGSPKGNSSNNNNIHSYSYFPTQTTSYHAHRDRLSLVRAEPAMWDRMLDECADLIRIFREHHADTERRFLRRVLYFLVRRPFRLHAPSTRPMNYVD